MLGQPLGDMSRDFTMKSFVESFLNLIFCYFRNAWATLGDMSRDVAMKSFVESVLNLMPHLKPYLQAQRKEEEVKREAL